MQCSRRRRQFLVAEHVGAGAATEFLEQVQRADMVKFAETGSDVTTAEVKLARAATGRDLVTIRATQPFFSIDVPRRRDHRPGGVPRGVRGARGRGVVAEMETQSAKLRSGLDQVAKEVGMSEYVIFLGRP
jgi:hypothetical protein